MTRVYFLLFFLLAIGCNRQRIDHGLYTTNPELYMQTVCQLNSVMMHDNFTPPVANRNYTYANIAAYECIAAGYPDQFKSLAGQLKQLTELPEPQNRSKIDFEFAAVTRLKLSFIISCKEFLEINLTGNLMAMVNASTEY